MLNCPLESTIKLTFAERETSHRTSTCETVTTMAMCTVEVHSPGHGSKEALLVSSGKSERPSSFVSNPSSLEERKDEHDSSSAEEVDGDVFHEENANGLEYSSESSEEGTERDISFDDKHKGKSADVAEKGRTARRSKKGTKDAVVLSNRTLRENELFEVELVKRRTSRGKKISVGSTKGSMRIGITAHRPEDVWPDMPQSMKLMSSNTWMMKEDTILEAGKPVFTYRNINLKNLGQSDRVGVMRTPEFNGSLVIFINGKEIGIIATAVPEEVYGFVELRGDNDKVAITGNSTVDESAMPYQIRAMREKEGHIRQLYGDLDEKEEDIDRLNERITAQGSRIDQLQVALRIAQQKKKKRSAQTQTKPRSPSPKSPVTASPPVPTAAQNEIELVELNAEEDLESVGGSEVDEDEPKKQRKTQNCCNIL